jgi:hypothetical protein
MRFRPALLLAACLASLIASIACSNQGEGEFCTVDSDCQNGLSCNAKAPGVTGTVNTSRCCPGDLMLATTPACSQSTAPIEAGSEVPDAEEVPEAGPAEAGTAPEASTDANSPDSTNGAALEAGPDATLDGALESGTDAAPE